MYSLAKAVLAVSHCFAVSGTSAQDLNLTPELAGLHEVCDVRHSKSILPLCNFLVFCMCLLRGLPGSACINVCDASNSACLHVSISVVRKAAVVYKKNFFSCRGCLSGTQVPENFAVLVSASVTYYTFPHNFNALLWLT